jgi:hypothetical protein
VCLGVDKPEGPDADEGLARQQVWVEHYLMRQDFRPAQLCDHDSLHCCRGELWDCGLTGLQF